MFPITWMGKLRAQTESKKRFEAKIYCGIKCRSVELSEKPPELNYFYGKSLVPWNKGKVKSEGWRVKQTSGYTRIIRPGGKFEYEHRNKVKAPKGLVVHHKDHNKSNNNPDNLQVMTQSEHSKLHWRERNAN